MLPFRSRWDVPVTEPHNIEVPRSLVDVVVSWNIPMHKWLKKCKFNFRNILTLEEKAGCSFL